MKVVDGFPPNIKAIVDALGPHFDGCVYAYGDTIYAPNCGPLPDHLIVHEEVHEVQHGDDPAGWWDRYLVDVDFRLEMEVEAYRAQWQFLLANYGRPERRRILRFITRDLSGPMYGNIVSSERAKELITDGSA